MELPPPSAIPTMVQDVPTFMPSGSRFLERFDEVPSPELLSRAGSAAESIRRSLPSIPYGKVPLRHASFMKKHGPMITTVVLTTIVFGLFISQAKSAEKLFPISAGVLISISAITILSRYYYSPCMTGQPWAGYLSIGSLFSSMILLGIWIAKSK